MVELKDLLVDFRVHLIYCLMIKKGGFLDIDSWTIESLTEVLSTKSEEWISAFWKAYRKVVNENE